MSAFPDSYHLDSSVGIHTQLPSYLLGIGQRKLIGQQLIKSHSQIRYLCRSTISLQVSGLPISLYLVHRIVVLK